MQLLVAAWANVELLSESINAQYLGWKDTASLTFTLAFGIVHSLTFFSMTLLYTMMESRGTSYKIMPHLKRPPRALLLECLANVAANHLLLQWLSHLFLIAPLLRMVGALDELTASAAAAHYDITSPWEHIWRVVLCALFEDTTFYWTHRTLHHRALYARFHKRHHSFVAVHPTASEHAHIVETLVGNLLPFYLGVSILRFHGSTFILWVWMRIAETVDGHSGFELPWPAKLILSPLSLGQARARHTFHHSHGGGPDGVGTTGVFSSLFPFWDWVCGTDRPFHAWRAGKLR